MKSEDLRNDWEKLESEEISNGFVRDLLELNCLPTRAHGRDMVSPIVTSRGAENTRNFEHYRVLMPVSRCQNLS